ncbi:MAG: glycine cleavage system protein H [Ignavibacteria bacterium GWA2_55_25]|nr:MAG: glycine cleavage system protein H [Ignavibacteria bacterium GWA2_55_25]
MNFPANLKYTKDHEWIRVEGNTGWIGITEYAQGELGDVVFVELPAVGTKLETGKSFGTIEAVKAVSDLYAPVAGEVTELNKEVQDSPELVNKEPYERGWMIKITIANPGEVNSLLDAESYKKLIAK